jgi:hypothetical protein
VVIHAAVLMAHYADAGVRRVRSSQQDHSDPAKQRTLMSDKSPRSTMSKKSGKSLKEKRAEKKAKGVTSSGVGTTVEGKKQR